MGAEQAVSQSMFQRCLICTDFSDSLHRLVHFVPSLAAGGIKQIVFMHSVPLWEEGEIPRVDKEKIQQAHDRLAQAQQDIPPGVEVAVEVVSGRPVETILKAVQTYQTDLILLGTPTRSLLNEKLFGSVTIALCRATTVPVMILRPQLISTYTSEELALRCRHLFRYLLIPYNGTNVANHLVQQLKHHALNQHADSLERCMLCWVVDDAGRRELPKDYQLQQAQETLSQIKADLALACHVDIEVRLGEPLTEILEVASNIDISAIAISSDSLGGLLELSVPSFAGELLRRSWYPVLFFPPHHK